MHVLIVFILLLLLEYFFRAMNYEKIPFWKSRALFIMVLTGTSLQFFEVSWDKVIPSMVFIHTSSVLPPPIAGFMGFILASLPIYWWHRAMHRSDVLWRYLHQLHHSPQRVEVIAAFYTHPLNALSVSLIASLMVHFIGLDVNALWWFSFYFVSVSLLTHANINIPRWVGYLIQTPNMHRFHHEYQVHHYNYSEFVLWDALFGTYKNPGSNPNRCGFDTDKELRLAAMLIGKDVNK